MLNELEQQFHKEMVNIYKRAKSECKYTPHEFLKMVTEQGGLHAAKTLLWKNDISYGFTKLYELGRLDLTVENLILKYPWETLFSAEEKEIATKRLQKHNYTPIKWSDAVLQAIQQYTQRNGTRKFTRKGLLTEELDRIKEDTQTQGITPEQTLSKSLQDLRGKGIVHFFDNRGTYILMDTPIEIESEDLPEEVLDSALESKKIIFGNVPTADEKIIGRYRKGQTRLRELTLQNYVYKCALCDVKDEKLLVASHISRWADDPEARGDLSNVICLCKFHDALFETGYFSFSDNLTLLRKKNVESRTVAWNLNIAKEFRKPVKFSPDPNYLRKHRQRTGYNT